MASDDTRYCRSCCERRPIEQFLDIVADWDPEHPEPTACARCRTEGPPKPDLFGELDYMQRNSLKVLMAGKTIAEAEKAGGYKKGTLAGFLGGRNVHPFRRAFQIALEMNGLDANTIIKVYGEAIKANRAIWNPKEEKFSQFPDHNVRLRTAQSVAKHHQLEYPKEDAKSQHPGVNVVINTNLGDGRKSRSHGMKAVSSVVSDDGKTLTVEAGESE